MYRYAQIDLDRGTCIGVSVLSGKIDTERMILLENDSDVQLGDIYTDGTWERLEPEPSPEPKPSAEDRFTAIATENSLLRAQNQALSNRADFIEDIIAEMAMKIY